MKSQKPPPFLERAAGQRLRAQGLETGAIISTMKTIAGGPPKQITRFETDKIISLAWSRECKHLAMGRTRGTSDAVLISNFK